MVKAICFDLDGVFFTGESFKRYCEKMAVNSNYEMAVQVLLKSEEMLAFKKGEMTEEVFWRNALKKLDLDMTKDEVHSALADSYEINPKVLDVVKKVRTMGLKTCICSNNFETRIREVNNKLNFLDHFDVKVFSFEVGYVKPDRNIFLKLIEACGVNPDEIVYSDDNDYAVNSAKEMGINAFLYEGFEPFLRKLNELGVNV